MEKYDAIVVGAGTAGCLAAKTIAESGLKSASSTRKNGKKSAKKSAAMP